MKVIEIQTGAREEMVDMTPKIREVLASSKVQTGVCQVYVPHTTAGVTINENADPTVRDDILMALRKIVPENLSYRHSEGNSTAHIKASLVGSAVYIPVEDGRLQLGTWQGVFFCEFDGPRRRRALVIAHSFE